MHIFPVSVRDFERLCQCQVCQNHTFLFADMFFENIIDTFIIINEPTLDISFLEGEGVERLCGLSQNVQQNY